MSSKQSPAQWVQNHFTQNEHHYDKPFKNKNGESGQLKSGHRAPPSTGMDDGYETGLLQDDDPLYGNSQRGVEVKRWDVFRVVPIEDSNSGNQRCLELTIRVLKVVTYILTFLLMLSCSVISKGTLLLMISQISNKTRTFCKNEEDRNHQYESRITTERVAWIWCIAFCFVIPEFFAFFRSARICIFKSYHIPRLPHFLTVAFFESLHTVGISALVFVVLPRIDSVKGAMLTNCTCLIPGVFALLSRYRNEEKFPAKLIIDVVAIVCQLSGLVVWPAVLSQNGNEENSPLVWAIPLSLFLVGFGWWENYVNENSPFAPIRLLSNVKNSLRRTRYFTYMILSVWKIMLFIAAMMGFLQATGSNASDLFTEFNQAFDTNRVMIFLKKALHDGPNTDLPFASPNFEESVAINPNSPIYLFVHQVSVGLVAYVVGKFTCRICIQGFSYAFPINLTVPVTISLLISVCGIRSDNPCFLVQTIPRHLYWECPDGGNFFGSFVSGEHNWLWLLWLLSQTWITLHIWTPKCERLASTEKLFVTPMYSGLLVDQSLGLNRRRNEDDGVKVDELEKEQGDDGLYDYYETIPNGSTVSAAATQKDIYKSDKITKIYACATMWHETKDEMIAMLKSVLRMDEDQCARRNAQKYLRISDPDYYEFETHVFFDDAFEVSDDNDEENIVNRFVKQLVNVMDEAASHVHQINIRVKPPKKYPASYGGRLVWTLPGKTKLIAHLKDKSKIRHRKRWSQVMYMYYLLGHKLMELNIPTDRKAVMAENTYLLTLDGDIDFQPSAVQLLVDLMKKNRNLGAACGRIHPIGTGPMVWYQKFEYAIGHWLQKATEHMIGCVLCSPGCFSLFRAKGLMDDNVMRRYTTQSDEARHYVQYDQGEDRWLCTLLLQRGYRVEYSAASDAYTQCPEGFGEFYNQRRRWVPSTMANILDLLMDSKRTIKVNDNISLPYIIYQGMLMAGTILGPGTIFLMLVGAFVAAFKIDNWTSFGANIVPILVFMIVCFICKSDHQLLLAQVLSAAYALIMMAVIVGISLQMREDGIGSPSFIFIVALSGSFFISALLHPQEFWCIVPGLLYYLSIPSMYLLLIIYSLTNLNNVTWGTREVLTKKTKQELAEEKKRLEEEKKKQGANQILNMLGIKQGDMSLSNLCTCMMCTPSDPRDEQIVLLTDTIGQLRQQLDRVESRLESHHGVMAAIPRRKTVSRTSNRSTQSHELAPVHEESVNDDSMSSDGESSTSLEPRQQRDDLINPYWIEDKDLRCGEVEYMTPQETDFWKCLLEKYLYPIDNNTDHQARVASELKELRNKAVFAFFMFNALFILIVFLLQLNKDNLYVQWPLGVKFNITYNEENHEVHVHKEYLHLEPIGLVFVFFFSLIIVIQFTAMLFHRFGTLSHILAATDLVCCNRKGEEASNDALIKKNAIQIARNLQKLKNLDGSEDGGSSADNLGRRTTIHNLERHRKRSQAVGTLDVAFRKRFLSISADHGTEATPILSGIRDVGMRRQTLLALEERRNTVMGGGSGGSSRMETLGARNSFSNIRNRHRPNSRSVTTAFPTRLPNGSLRGGGITNDAFEEEEEENSPPHSPTPTQF